MNKSLKALSIVVLLAFVFTTFAACGQQQSAPAQTANSEGSNAKTTQETKTQEEKKPVTLTVYHWRQEDKAGWDYFVEQMKAKYPEITMQVEVVTGNNYYDLRRTRALSGELSDVFMIDASIEDKKNFSQYCLDLNGLEGINNLMDEAKGAFQDFDGKLMGAALGTFFSGIVFYNKDIFEKNGLSVPNTWADFIKACEKIKASGIAPLSVGAKDGWPSNMVVEAIQLPYFRKDFKDYNAAQLLDMAKKGELKYTDDRFKTVVERYKELCDKDLFMMNSIGVSYDQSVQAFIKGDAAMLISGNWTIGPVKEAKPDFNLGVFAVPSDTSNDGEIGIFFAQAMAINKDSKNIDAAKKFINLMCDTGVHQKYMDLVKQFPSVKGIKVSWDPVANDLLSFTSRKLFTASNWPEGGASKVAREKLSQEAILKTVTVERYISEMQAALEEDIKDIK